MERTHNKLVPQQRRDGGGRLALSTPVMLRYQGEQTVNAGAAPGKILPLGGKRRKKLRKICRFEFQETNQPMAQPSDEGLLGPAIDFEADDPFPMIAAWLDDAGRTEPADPNAMSIATAGRDGMPNVRMILLKGLGPDGLVFYTNAESAKGGELAANPQAAICLYWKSLGRQIRARGPVTPATAEEADAYFATRHRESRIGAWASQQSRPLPSREVLEEAIRLREEEFGEGAVPRPPHWRGYRLVPLEIEFWQNRPFRLHDRLLFRRDGPGKPWVKTRLYP